MAWPHSFERKAQIQTASHGDPLGRAGSRGPNHPSLAQRPPDGAKEQANSSSPAKGQSSWRQPLSRGPVDRQSHLEPLKGGLIHEQEERTVKRGRLSHEKDLCALPGQKTKAMQSHAAIFPEQRAGATRRGSS